MSQQLAELEARMAAADYEPILAGPTTIAAVFEISKQAPATWASREDRTGVRRYPGGKYDVNAIARWLLLRDESKVTRANNRAEA